MDLFRSPSFQPEKLTDKSLFLFLHLLSLTDFVNCPNWSKPVLLPDFLSGNRLWQVPSHSYVSCSSRLEVLSEVEHIVMGAGGGDSLDTLYHLLCINKLLGRVRCLTSGPADIADLGFSK
jgi:hypothetical protein